jgi:hypothetical protein
MTDEDPRSPYDRLLFGMSHVIWVPAIIILGVLVAALAAT